MCFSWARERRRIVHFAVTVPATAESTAQQLREAFPWDSVPRYLLRDRDQIFGRDFVDQVKVMGIKQCFPHRDLPGRGLISNGSLARFAASVWITSSSSESALSIVLSSRMFPITTSGSRLSLGKDAPQFRRTPASAERKVVEIREVGGLHHDYE